MLRFYKRYLAVTLTLLSLLLSALIADAKSVLYVTHEPGRYHKYTPQLAAFKEIGEKAGWKVTVMTGTYDEQLVKLRAPDFGKGYDAIVYNFCFAKSNDLEAASNVMAQTRKHGVPALLIHCAMHSWWGTYKTGKPGALGPNYKGHSKAVPELVAEWKARHGDRPFPVWGDFTGIASEKHGPKKPIIMKKLIEHPATQNFPDSFTTGNTELYNNVYVVDGVVNLIEGEQGNTKHVVMWTCPQGKSKVMGLTVGHDMGDWQAEPFQNLIRDGVNYLIANPKSK